MSPAPRATERQLEHLRAIAGQLHADGDHEAARELENLANRRDPDLANRDVVSAIQTMAKERWVLVDAPMRLGNSAERAEMELSLGFQKTAGGPITYLRLPPMWETPLVETVR